MLYVYRSFIWNCLICLLKDLFRTIFFLICCTSHLIWRKQWNITWSFANVQCVMDPEQFSYITIFFLMWRVNLNVLHILSSSGFNFIMTHFNTWMCSADSFFCANKKGFMYWWTPNSMGVQLITIYYLLSHSLIRNALHPMAKNCSSKHYALFVGIIIHRFFLFQFA